MAWAFRTRATDATLLYDDRATGAVYPGELSRKRLEDFFKAEGFFFENV